MCDEAEDIPREVVEMLDGMDVEHSPFEAPQFSCESCGGDMYLEVYRNELGYEFNLEDVR